MSTQGGALMSTPGGGCSAIFGPDGRQLTALLEPTEEGIVYAELDFDAAIFAKSFLVRKTSLQRNGFFGLPTLTVTGCLWPLFPP